MSEKAVEIHNISKGFHDFKLKEVGITLEKGTIMGIVGANGAGKTTLMKCMMNMYSVDEGHIRIWGYDTVDDEIRVKNLVGYVAAEDYFNNSLNLRKLSDTFSRLYDEWDWALYKEYVKRWGLPEDKRFSGYSKGMKTRAMFILAVSHKPKVLLLDEPTAGLDPMVRRDVLGLLREFVENEENSVIFSTHITTDLDKVADYITVLDNGVVMESERTDAIEDKYIVISGEGVMEERFMDSAVGVIQEHGRYEALLKKNGMEYHNVSIRRPLSEDLMIFYSAGRNMEV